MKTIAAYSYITMITIAAFILWVLGAACCLISMILNIVSDVLDLLEGFTSEAGQQLPVITDRIMDAIGETVTETARTARIVFFETIDRMQAERNLLPVRSSWITA